MWHPHLKKMILNEKLTISDELNKIYPTQLLQLRTSMLKGGEGTAPKMSCGCKFINTITSIPSLIQKSDIQSNSTSQSKFYFL